MTKLAARVDGIRTVTGSADRDLLYPSPLQGQKVHRTDTNSIERYNSGSWVTAFYGEGASPTFLGMALAESVPASNSVVKWVKTYALTTGPFYGLNSAVTGAKTSASFDGYMIGAVAHAALGASNTQNWVGDSVHVPLVAMWGQVDTESLSAGTLTEAACFNAVRTFAGSSIVTKSSGLRIGTPTINGVVQNLYGIYIHPQAGGTVTNYAIYVEGGQSLFQGIDALAISATGLTLTDPGTNGVATVLITRNASAGVAAINRARFGNSASVNALTIDVFGGSYTGTPNRVQITNQNNAEMALGTNGADVLTLTAAGDIKWHKAMVALGGGAAPTVGTIGGSGPAVAAQRGWLRLIESDGTASFLPLWR